MPCGYRGLRARHRSPSINLVREFINSGDVGYLQAALPSVAVIGHRGATGRCRSIDNGGIIHHNINWSGHYLVGYSVAILLTFLISTGYAGVRHGQGWWRLDVRPSATWSAGPPDRAPAPGRTATPIASSCDRFEKAFLKGHGIGDSVQAIVDDETADPTAREIARLYLNRDETNTSRKLKDLEIIYDYCGR